MVEVNDMTESDFSHFSNFINDESYAPYPNGFGMEDE